MLEGTLARLALMHALANWEGCERKVMTSLIRSDLRSIHVAQMSRRGIYWSSPPKVTNRRISKAHTTEVDDAR